jgi:hypothetical protein
LIRNSIQDSEFTTLTGTSPITDVYHKEGNEKEEMDSDEIAGVRGWSDIFIKNR